MKTIDIENQKKTLKTAVKILNCILKAKGRIEYSQRHADNWLPEFFYTQRQCQNDIDTSKRAIVRLEQRYAKTISQL